MPQNIKSDPLANLHDIIAPSMPSWWPLPVIYWLILLTVLMVIGISVYFFKRHQKQRKSQLHYFTALSQLENNGCDLIELNKLLKMVSIIHLPRAEVASLHGNTWFDFLVSHSSLSETILFKGRQQFISQLYEQSPRKCDNSDFQQAKKWIKQLPSFIKSNNKAKKSASKNEGAHV